MLDGVWKHQSTSSEEGNFEGKKLKWRTCRMSRTCVINSRGEYSRQESARGNACAVDRCDWHFGMFPQKKSRGSRRKHVLQCRMDGAILQNSLKRSSRVKLWFVCESYLNLNFFLAVNMFFKSSYWSKWKGILYGKVGRESTHASIWFSSSMNKTPMFCYGSSPPPPPPRSSHDGIIDSLRLIFLNGNPIPERRLVHARVRCSLPLFELGASNTFPSLQGRGK